jgi:hypothetical protein
MTFLLRLVAFAWVSLFVIGAMLPASCLADHPPPRFGARVKLQVTLSLASLALAAPGVLILYLTRGKDPSTGNGQRDRADQHD